MSSQQVLRPLRLWPSWFNFHHHHHHLNAAQLALHRRQLLLLISQQPQPIKTRRFSSLAPSRGILRRVNAPLPTTKTTDLPVEEGEEEPKSRNQLKREAKRAVKWGMDLASFSPPQIKLILKLASLDKIVYDALILVKKLGPDVREGRRRQFSYIGKLLRDVEPELMDRLIKATKDSDHKELQALTALVSEKLDDDNLIETEYEEEEEEDEESNWDEDQVTRWFDGLVNKDIQITNEVFSVQGVEFDRQELRKLVREVHIAQEKKDANEEEDKEKKLEKTINKANKALTRFLRGLSKRITDEYYY